MHEQSLTEKVLRIVLAEARHHQARQVTKVTLTVGELSGIVPESVELFFQILAAETAAAGAKLEFKIAKALLFCPCCQTQFDKRSGDFFCPSCGGLGRLTDAGREFQVESIEIE